MEGKGRKRERERERERFKEGRKAGFFEEKAKYIVKRGEVMNDGSLTITTGGYTGPKMHTPSLSISYSSSPKIDIPLLSILFDRKEMKGGKEVKRRRKESRKERRKTERRFNPPPPISLSLITPPAALSLSLSLHTPSYCPFLLFIPAFLPACLYSIPLFFPPFFFFPSRYVPPCRIY
jgi:hypothetical protein